MSSDHLASTRVDCFLLRAAALGLAGLCAAGSVFAGFGISPTRLDLHRGVRTSSITATNDDSTSPIRAQVDAVSWVQDQDGNDRFEPTGELTFLPRIMTIPPEDRQLIRVGIRVPATEREKAFRLFVEELAEPQKAAEPGAKVAVRVRFGIPVFVKPLKEEVRGEIDLLTVERGIVTVRVRNQGNVHFGIQSIQVSESDLFSTQISGWYLLPGAARVHSLNIPAETCRKLKGFEVVVKTDRFDLKRRLELDQSSCG